MVSDEQLPVNSSKGEQQSSVIAQSPFRFLILALGGFALTLTWGTLSAGFFGEASIIGWETDIGKVYFIILVAIIAVEFTGNVGYIRKAWLVGGVLLALAVLGQMTHMQSVTEEIEAQAAAEGFEGMVGMSFGGGIYLALGVGIGVTYIGYQITSESVSPSLDDAVSPIRDQLQPVKKLLSHPVIQPKYGSWPNEDESPHSATETATQSADTSPSPVNRPEMGPIRDPEQDDSSKTLD